MIRIADQLQTPGAHADGLAAAHPEAAKETDDDEDQQGAKPPRPGVDGDASGNSERGETRDHQQRGDHQQVVGHRAETAQAGSRLATPRCRLSIPGSSIGPA